MDILISIAIFTTIVLFIEGIYFVYRVIRNPEKKRVRRHVRTWSSLDYRNEPIDIVRKRVLSDVPWLNSLLLSIPKLLSFERLLTQANIQYRMGTFLLLAIVLAFLGLWLSSFMINSLMLNMLGAVAGGMAPFVYVYQKKRQRMLRFQRQFADALDLIARALKAGHPFTVGMKMVGDEFPDPIGTEFYRTTDEINFGIAVPEALKNFAHRVDCSDLNFFVTSVLIQRETGGNLAEIVENLSSLIRKRFELHGRIRVLAAEGKLSAIVLFALPFMVALVLSFTSPKYLKFLVTDPVGNGMVGFAALMMSVGAFVTKNMIKIRV